MEKDTLLKTKEYEYYMIYTLTSSTASFLTPVFVRRFFIAADPNCGAVTGAYSAWKVCRVSCCGKI